MKKFLTLLILAAIMVSCSSSNDVVNNGFFQKRKHRTGFHINGLAHAQGSRAAKTKNDLRIEKQIPFDDSVDQEEFEITQEIQSKKETKFFEVKSVSRRKYKSAIKAFKRNKKQDHEFIIHDEAMTERALLESKESKEENDPLMTAAILSLVFAGISLMLITVPLVNIVFGVLALVLGRRAMKSENENVQMMGKIGSIAGLVLTILSVLITLLFIGYIALLVAFSGGF
jgi:hypothetical protein